MGRAPGTRRARRRLVRIGLQPGNQAFQIIGREILPGADQPWRTSDECDRRKILEHVVVQLIDRAVDDMSDRRPINNGVAVGVARATRPVPIEPDAPVTFSITTG